jgi:ketosteroid isomerase-like protein
MTEQTDIARAARNVELVQAGYDAFTRGDLAAVEKLFDPEVVWHAQRLGALSGDHGGWPEVLRFFGETMELSKGTFRVTAPACRRRSMRWRNWQPTSSPTCHTPTCRTP